MTVSDIFAIYAGSDGDKTRGLYECLTAIGPSGFVATNVFRATKASERAKVYRGGERGKGSYRRMAYERKQWSIDNLCKALTEHAASLSISWGWARDEKTTGYEWVCYIALPTGQVSFHSPHRGEGPDFPGTWDGVRGEGPARICRWCADLLEAADA